MNVITSEISVMGTRGPTGVVVENRHLAALLLLGATRGISCVVELVTDIAEYAAHYVGEEISLSSGDVAVVGNDNGAAAVWGLLIVHKMCNGAHGLLPLAGFHVS